MSSSATKNFIKQLVMLICCLIRLLLVFKSLHKMMGVNNTVRSRYMGFLGGYNGLFIKNELDSIYLNNDFVEIKEETRNCIAILAAEGRRTEILEAEPMIRPAAKR